MKEKNRKPKSRVFFWLVNKAAFVDKIVLSVDGKLKADFEYELLGHQSRGILRPSTIYCRAVSGIFGLTGNPVGVLYARARRFKNVPHAQIIMQSEVIPVTASQPILLINQLTAGASRITVSSLEFTLDFSGTTIDDILRHLIYRARGPVKVLSDGKRRTLYIGSPRSAWQVRIYEKRRAVVRLEFILRRRFLARHGINRPEDVMLLRRLRLWDLLSIRRFSASSAARVTKTWENTLGKEIVATWAYYKRELKGIIRFLRSHGTHPHRVLRRTRLQRRLEKMQRRFVW